MKKLIQWLCYAIVAGVITAVLCFIVLNIIITLTQ